MFWTSVEKILGKEAKYLLEHKCQGVPAKSLSLPGSYFVSRVWEASDRPIPVLRSLQNLFSQGRLADSGYLSILPVDQGIEHSAGASFAPNPIYFDPAGIVELAMEAGCSGVASTLGVLGMVRYQVLNCYAGRAGLINSGGAAQGQADMAEAVRTAVINKRAGGMGLIMGRKAFQRPMKEGVALIQSVQDVYLDKKITIA